MRVQLLKKLVILLAFMFITQGCAIFISDPDDYPHHREHGRHEHSSLETIQSAQHADEGKKMAGNQKSLVAEHQEG